MTLSSLNRKLKIYDFPNLTFHTVSVGFDVI